MNTLLKSSLLLSACVLAVTSAQANEAVIRKNLQERLPQWGKPDEVRPTPVTGLWEVRFGSEVHYTDATGSYLLEGPLIDLKSRRNLTEERVAKLTAIDFNQLPFKDAVVWKSGTGKRKIAVFADPNCGFCKRLEKSLQDVKDVTVYTFVLPILGPDSTEKSRGILCAKDTTAAWRNWMLDGVAPPKAPNAQCDEGTIDRMLAFGKRHGVNGTPAIVFEDGSRVPGAMNTEQLERKLQGLKS